MATLTLPPELPIEEIVGRLQNRGWERKAGLWHGPDEGGRLVPMWPNGAFYGKMPKSPDAAMDLKAMRASCQPGYEVAFSQFLRKIGEHGDQGAAFAALASDEQKALSEGSDVAGGFAVPIEMATQIISVVRERAVVRPAAIVLPTVRDAIGIPVFDYTAEWVYELPPAADTVVTPIELTPIRVWKVRAKVAASFDLDDDQDAFRAWFVASAADQIALAEDRAFVSGTGIGQPLGLINTMSAGTTAIAGTSPNTISNTTAAAGSAPLIIALDDSLADTYRKAARWFGNSTVLTHVHQLIATTNAFVFESYANKDGEDMLRSHPVSIISTMPSDGTSLARCLALCDVSQYVVATRNLLTVRFAVETYGDLPRLLIYVYDRIGGALGFPAAVVVGTT